MRKILSLIVVVLIGPSPIAGAAGDIGAEIARLGLIGVWASDCVTETTGARPGFRIVFAVPDNGSPTYTTISSDAGVRTTVISIVLSATRISDDQLRLRLRITGGDRDGGPLPSPTTNTFEQTIEHLAPDRIRLIGTSAQLLQRCPQPGR